LIPDPETKKRPNNPKLSSKRLRVPEEFSLINNTEETINYINKLKSNFHFLRKTFVDLQNVKKITNDAIIVLLSIVSQFPSRKIAVSGNKPKDVHVCDILEQSGFFDHVSGVISSKNASTKSKIITEKYIQVKSDITSILVSEAVETVFGEKGRSPGIQRALVELMGNTFEHATLKEEKEHWWLSIFHDFDGKKVCFSFVDNGLGILETLKPKPIYSLLASLNFKSPKDILKEAMTGEIGSRHQLKSRGQGLPSFITSQDRNSFDNLIVISNSACGKITDDFYVNLNNEFTGTLFYWEFNENHKWIK
jgi:hypothetical protein